MDPALFKLVKAGRSKLKLYRNEQRKWAKKDLKKLA